MITGNIEPSGLPGLPLDRRRDRHNTNATLVPHHRFAERIVRDLKLWKFHVGRMRCGVTPDGLDMILAVEANPDDVNLKAGQSIWLGATNSNSGRRTMYLYAGIMCDKVPVVCGRYKVDKRKGRHWQKDVEVNLGKQLDLFALQCGEFHNRVRHMKRRYVSRPDADIMHVEACRRGIISWSAGKYLERFRKEREGDRSAWALYSALALTITEFNAPVSYNPLTDQLNRMFLASRLVLEEMGDEEEENAA